MKTHSFSCYCATLRQAARAVTVLYEKMIAEGDLHATQYTALQLIETVPGLTTTELAEAMGMDQTTATRSLALMKGRGLATNTVGQDRRLRRWNLTSAGQEELRKLKPRWEAAQRTLELRLGRAQAIVLKDAAYLTASRVGSR